MVEKEWPSVGDVCLIKRFQDEKATRYRISMVRQSVGKLAGHVLTEGIPSPERTEMDWSEVEAITNPAPTL